MHFTSEQITSLIGSYMWPLFRIAAMITAMPVFGTILVPHRARLVFAVVLTMVVAPLVPSPHGINPFSLAAVTIIVQQIVIGIAMGFALQLVFSAVTTGGQVIAMQMGLGFASMVDPQNGNQVPVLSQFYLLIVTLLFLGFDGHLVMIRMLVDSFHIIPIGVDDISRNGMWALVSWGSEMFAGAVWMALPAMASLLVVNIAFGVMARAAPQLNIFVIGFPVALIMGFIVIMYTLPSIVPQFSHLLSSGFDLVGRVLSGG